MFEESKIHKNFPVLPALSHMHLIQLQAYYIS